MQHVARVVAQPSSTTIGQRIHALAARLYPLNRSITGEGVRQSLDILGESIHLERHEVPTGTTAFDWTVPKEWGIRGGFIKDPSGRTIVDFAHSNLHVMGYSMPVHDTLSLEALKPHLHTLPEQPDLIPYRTSYYTEDWGFCLAHRDFLALPEGDYEVRIDSVLFDGHLTYGEALHRGESGRDVLLSTHICHPSLANDNCAGLAVLTFVAAALKERRTRYTYRFLFAPGTIGALVWLSRNEQALERIDHGLVLACIGDNGGPTYKKTRNGHATIDRIAACMRLDDGKRIEITDFTPYGYDERQFNAPGFQLPIGQLQRSRHGTFPEYHTSADNLDFIRPEHMEASFRMVMDMIDALESNWVPLNLYPKGEPQLGRRGLYAAMGGQKDAGVAMAFLWVLNLADGDHSLLDIAERADMAFSTVERAADLLLQHGLLSRLCDA
ncbi:DUF4910 domain-containing protein [Rhizobium sp. Root482]|uniref:DUF4910 domain-containing protein n=1 Tax=Rhizobium sp. Root482 TaxID=1736543 RepID=UPI0006FF7C04|nr:DUF4910 domain-containing protein [Rhizobium sp. Root482]KQY27225.1 hypothetical protein ASD31_00165 [Rhizobium sp. Root482]